MKYLILLVLLVTSSPAYASGGHASRHIKPIKITDAWARATLPAMRSSAAYMKITNNTNKEDCLVKAEAKEFSEHTSLHTTTEDENGMLSMVHVENMCIPANSTVELSPGKFHIMFMRLSKQLLLGHELPIALTFKNAGVLRTRAAIKPLSYKGKKNSSHGNH